MAPFQSMNHTAPSSAREERAALDEALKKIETRPSGVHGLGTFTKCALSEGQIFWWLNTETKVLPITRTQHDLLLWAAHLHPEKNASLNEAVHCYCYYEEQEGALMFILDGGRYLNHSDKPNSRFVTLPHGTQVTVAACDLPAGTEIVEDYFTYDRAPWCPAPLSKYLIPDLEDCKAEGQQPEKGEHVLFELSKERYEVLKASPLPDGLGRVFFDACVPDGKGGAKIVIEI